MGRRLIFPLRYGMPWGGDRIFHFATACRGAEIVFSTSLRHAVGRRLIFPLRHGMPWDGDGIFHFATACRGAEIVFSTSLLHAMRRIDFSTSLRHAMGRRLIFSPRYGMPWDADSFSHFATACHGAEIGFSTSLRHAMRQRSVFPLRYAKLWDKGRSTLLRCTTDKPPYQSFYDVRICCAVPNGWCFAHRHSLPVSYLS